MKGSLAVQEKKKGTVLPASRFLQHAAVQPIADHTAQAEPAGALTESRFGQDFSQVAIHSESGAARSELTPPCPVTPTRCPFGGACHTCPAHVQARRDRDQAEDTPTQVPPIVHEVLRSPGRPLDPATHAFMEPRFAHDFSGVPKYASGRDGGQTVISTHLSPHGLPLGGASRTGLRPVQAKNALDHLRNATAVCIPVAGEEEQSVRLGPERDNGGGGGGTGAVGGGAGSPLSDSCSQPLSMTKVTSGSFQGGFSMGDYYPDLVGRGYWQHGSTAGPFDTGSRVGSNVQLYGTFPSPCRPELFSLAQSFDWKRYRRNGVKQPEEGQRADDIARSGRDASRPPFRRDWLGSGYNVSMADPPSDGYGPGDNIEDDCDFVTSLVGPGGRASVSWSISIRIENGVVTRNMVS